MDYRWSSSKHDSGGRRNQFKNDQVANSIYLFIYLPFIISIEIEIEIEIEIGLFRHMMLMMLKIFACPEIKDQLKTLIWIMLNKLLLTHT